MMCDPQDPSHCLELFDRLCEYLDGEMEEAECREIEVHIAQCAACLGFLESLRRTIALCKHAGCRTVPAVFSEKLHTMIQHMQAAR